MAQSIAGVVGPAYEMNAALAEVGSKGVAEDALKRLSGEAMRFSMRYGKGAVDVVRSSYAMKGAMAGLSDLDLPASPSRPIPGGRRQGQRRRGRRIHRRDGVTFQRGVVQPGHVRFAEELAGKTAYMVQNFGVKMQTMQELIEGRKAPVLTLASARMNSSPSRVRFRARWVLRPAGSTSSFTQRPGCR